MNRILMSVAAVAFSLGFAAQPLHAQLRTVELGLDGGVTFTSGSGVENTFDVSVPVQSARVGFFLTDQVSLEPALTLIRLDFGNDQVASGAGLFASALYHLTPDRSRLQVFGQAGGGMEHVRMKWGAGMTEKDTQWLAGAGAGVKIPVMDRVSVRLAAVYWRAFESDMEPDSNRMEGNFGVSFFTR